MKPVSALRKLVALVLREVESGPLSPIVSFGWALSEPILGILLLSVLFMIAFPAPPLGDSFALFYATGLLPLILVQDLSQRAIVAVRFSKPLLGFARISLIDLVLGRLFYATLVQITVSAAVLGLFLFYAGWPSAGGLAVIASAYLAAIWLGAGFGMVGCWLSGVVPLWPRLWAVALRPLVLVSGVFFLIDDVGDPFRGWLLLNPMAAIIMQVRSGVYGFYDAPLANLGAVWWLGGLCMALGLWGLIQSERLIVDDMA